MMPFNKLIIIFGLYQLAACCYGERARYDNYRIYKAVASNQAELEVLKNLEGSSDSIMFLNGIYSDNKPIQVVVAPHKLPDFLEIMATNEIEYELVEKDLQKQLDDGSEIVAQSESLNNSSSYNWNQYYELQDTYDWLQLLAKEYPGIVTLIEGGQTYENRKILGVKIAKNAIEKPGVFIEAGIHPREWISSATATFVINQLLNPNETSIEQLADNYSWYIFPHSNPDGYVYTHTTDRMWRKTRTRYGNCYGADLNRNWDFQWNYVGASNDPCSNTYSGSGPFSEIEARSLADYLQSLSGKISLYISLHSYSQLLLYPYGYTRTPPANYNDLKQVFDVSIAAISKRYGTKYRGGSIYNTIYPISGNSIDWVYTNTSTKMAFCYELRPIRSSDFGFRLPSSEIIPTGEETLDSIVAMVNEVQKLGYFN